MRHPCGSAAPNLQQPQHPEQAQLCQGMLCAPSGVTNALLSSDNPTAIGLPALSASIPRLGQHCPGVRHCSSRCSGGPAIKWRRSSHSRDLQWGGNCRAPQPRGGAEARQEHGGSEASGNREPAGPGADRLPWAMARPGLASRRRSSSATLRGPFVRPAGPGAPRLRSPAATRTRPAAHARCLLAPQRPRAPGKEMAMAPPRPSPVSSRAHLEGDATQGLAIGSDVEEDLGVGHGETRGE